MSAAPPVRGERPEGDADLPSAPSGSDSRLAPSRPEKRSFSIKGHKTSISLEAAFWEALRELAEEEGRSLASIVAEIDQTRGGAGLSGAVRVWILERYRARADGRAAERGPPSSPAETTD